MDRPIRVYLVRGRTCIGWMQMTWAQWKRILEILE